MADREPLGDLGAVRAFVRRLRRPAAAGGDAARSRGSSSGVDAGSRPDRGPSPSPISRRRLALVAGGLVLALVAVAFGHQVGDAAAASERAAQLRSANDALRSDLTNLQADLGRVQDDTYVAIAARSYGLGLKHEIPVVLAPGAATLPPDAPGSAALRVGAEPIPGSPLGSWLDLLFGPGSG